MSEENKHLAKMFHKKFEAIPDEKWCVGCQIDSHGRRCALGHVSGSDNTVTELSGNVQFNQLQNLFPWINRHDLNSVRWCIVAINNGRCPDYQQPTPKARVLAALEDIIRQ